MTFNPGKPINHSNKSHTLGFAQGGHVRLSTNVEDRRVDRSWNAKAKAAIDARYDDAGEEDSKLSENNYKPIGEMAKRRMNAMTSPAGTQGKTPANNGIDDLFTKTNEFNEDPDAPRQSKVRNLYTKTPGEEPSTLGPNGEWRHDGGSPKG